MSVIARKARDEYSPKFCQLGKLELDTSECFVQQHQAADCDINNIMARYERDGLLPHVNQFQGQYGDFTGVVDYQSALNVVMNAEDCFLSLPAQIRKRFDNDPGSFLDFVTNPENRDEMISMGLVPKGAARAAPDANEPKGEAEAAPEGA